MKEEINSMYDDVRKEIIDEKVEANIEIEELLRIHYYFDEIVINGILEELGLVIGDTTADVKDA